MKFTFYTATFLLLNLFSYSSILGDESKVRSLKLKDLKLNSKLLRVHFIDVGAGLAVFIQTPGNRKRIFIDGGKQGINQLSSYVQHFVPQNRKFDLAILTHADTDHFKGMGRIFERYKVSEFWYSGYKSSELPKGWPLFLKTVRSQPNCIQRNPLNAWRKTGDMITIDEGLTDSESDDIKILLLNTDNNPPARDPISNRPFDEGKRRNNASLVFKLIFGKVSFLFTGDINGRKPKADWEYIDSEELELWSNNVLYPKKLSLKADVLQVSHHGASGSSSLPFLKFVRPKWAVIPAGNNYRHPRKDVLDRLNYLKIPVLRTDHVESNPTGDDKDELGDDNIIFQASKKRITRIYRVSVLD